MVEPDLGAALKVTRRSLIGTAAGAQVVAQPPGRTPNIIFLISDDHTARDLGCYGNAVIHTPNLDRMAREGTRFERCFVSSPQCSPNRSSILTGCAPHTTSTSRLHTPMPKWEPAFIEPLRARGYYTAAFGKVHQGSEFDRRWDSYGGFQFDFERALDAARGRPFFLHVGFRDPHRPYKPGAFTPPHDPKRVHVPAFLPDTAEVRQDLAHYHDAIARMDAECGRVLDLVRARGLERDTIVFFTGDNGMPFPRAKGGCYDPGLHVPLLVWGPGRVAAGAVSKALIAHVDLAPTWLALAGVESPKKMQGRSFLPLLTGGSHTARTEIFAERNWHDNFDPIRAVRTERHKLIFNAAPHFPYRPAWDLEGSPSWRSYLDAARRGALSAVHLRLLDPSRPLLELYDLAEDPNEFHNLASSAAHRDVLEDLKRRLSQWMHATYDYLPPAYSSPGEPRGRGWPVSL